MKQEIIQQIKQYQEENSNIKLSQDQFQQIIQQIETNLGKELTGYPTIDEPYQQFYNKELKHKQYPKKNIFHYIIETSNKYPDRIAYEYYNRKITFKELADNIMMTTYILKEEIGLKENDFAVFVSPSTPEAIYLFFALNAIGAISRPIDPVSSPNVVKANLLETNSKLLITLDLNYNKYKDMINELEGVKVISISLSSSLPLGILPFGPNYQNIENIFVNIMTSYTKLLFAKENNQQPNWLNWNTLTKKAITNKSSWPNTINYEYQKDQIVSILSTSGSTGEPKGVCLTNENFIASIEKQVDANFILQDSWKIFNPMPTCSSYFWCDILLAIRYGMTTKLSPLFNAEKSPKLLLKANCEINLLGPIILEKWNDFIEKTEKQGKQLDLSHQKMFISGGDLLFLELERKTNEIQKRHGSSAIVANAIGTSEQVGPSTSPNGVLADKNAYQEGSVGVILPGNSMGIFAYDEENDCPNINTKNYEKGLMYYQIGEICYKKENANIFKEYYKNKKATNEVFLTHPDGTIWYHTGDLGYLDIDGRLFCSGRKNGLIISDGHKVWTPKIENITRKINGIIDCSVIGVADEKRKEVPVIFIKYASEITEEQKKQLQQIIHDQILYNLDEYHLPNAYLELPEIPRNLMLKAKISELNKLYDEYLEKETIKGNTKKLKLKN